MKSITSTKKIISYSKKLGVFFLLTAIFSCASAPKSTAVLSEKLGEDLRVVQQAHLNIIDIHFEDIKRNINSFIDETYTPFIINFVLSKEYSSYQQNQPSLFLTLENAAKIKSKANSDSVVTDMQNFLSAAKNQIEKKRKSLIDPIEQQEQEVKAAINYSYSNMLNANNVITNYLQSIQKLKNTQSEALSKMGLTGADVLITQNLSKLSNEVNNLVQKGNNIDVKSEGAFKQIEEVSSKIKTLINN